MELHGHHQIGARASHQARPGFQARNPATGETLPPLYPDATTAEVDEALHLAADAHLRLKALPRERRAQLLEAIAEALEALGEPLLERASAETGLPLPRLRGERARTTGQLRLFAAEVREGSFLDARIDRADLHRQPQPRPDIRSLRQALGPVVVFGASNFPLAFSVAGGDTASALAAGCPVVVKAHPHHPGTSELTARAVATAVARTGLPAGTFSLLHGQAKEVGAALVTHPLTRAVAFTGSLAGGRALFDLARARPEPIPVYAEMGSVNPVFLLPEALEMNAEEIAQGLAVSVTLGSGQFCTNPGLVIGLAGEAFTHFATRVAQLLDATAPTTLLHEGIRRGYQAGLERLGKVPGVQRLTRNPQPTDLPACQAQATAFLTQAATVASHPDLLDEVFGPATLLVACQSQAELQTLATHLPGQLTATLHATASDLTTFANLPPILTEKAGRLVFNGFPTGVEVSPAIHHGGPYPATTDVTTTSVGTRAIHRFTRPVCYQNAPAEVLPTELRDGDAESLLRLVDGEWGRAEIT